MELKELNEKSKAMLAEFINEIGLDGNYYVQTNCKAPVTYGIPTGGVGCGEYITPHSRKMECFLKNKKFEERILNIMEERGLIVINRKYKNEEPNFDMFVTVIHEIIHSSRNLMLYDAYRDEENSAYILNDGKLEQNTFNLDITYGDASQDIIKGKVESTHKNISKYESMNKEDIEDIIFRNDNNDDKIEKQTAVDETLVDIMAVLSYEVYNKKENNVDIWTLINKMKEKSSGRDIKAMCSILLKHKDFELFNWMLNPIEYSNGDIHYDFFEEYTKNDQELVNEIYLSEQPDLEEDFIKVLKNGVIEEDKYDNETQFNVKIERQKSDDLVK